MGDPDQEAARAVIRAMLRDTGLTLTELAREAGVTPSTLTRFYNNPNVKHAPSMRTMRKIQAAAIKAIKGVGRSPPERPAKKRQLRVVKAPASARRPKKGEQR